MKNSILVIPTPSSCSECQLMVDRFCYGIPMDETHFDIDIDKRPSWCPLIPLPKKHTAHNHNYHIDEEEYLGWNDCIDAITGGTNESSISG